MPHLKLSFLGAVQITLDDKPVRNFRSAKAQALLAYLAVESDRPHSRDVLANLFWSENHASTARQNLRQTLRRLCLALNGHDSQAATAASFLSITRRTLQFNVASDYWLDVAEFLTCLKQREWERAVALYRGYFLTGMYLSDSVVFEEWATIMREKLHCQALQALHLLTQHYQTLADYDRAQVCARRQLALEPWQERAYRQLMQALAANGQRCAALAQYKSCHRILMEEFGIEPGAETAALYAHIRDR
jgi:DNA-binding SARP family transcriptional activator